MSDDDFKRLEDEFLALARRIFDAGAKAERARLVGLIQASSPMAMEVARPARKARAAGYGAVSAPVREALVQLAPGSPHGIGPRQIAEHFQRIGGGPNERQVRAALKTLTLSGEAVRASRGRYLPRGAASPSSGGENPDDDTSGHLDLAAE
jgi:hypothetical protein